MRTPTVVNVHPPASVPRYREAGDLDMGDMFLTVTPDPELFITIEYPRAGQLLQVMSIETGNIESLSKSVLIQPVTTVITVLGDTQIA